MATFRKRGLRWEAQVRRRGLPEVTKRFDRKVDAEAWAAVVESEITRGVFRDRATAAQFTFDDLLARYALEVTPSKKGAGAERCQIDLMRRDPLARVVLSNLTAHCIADWRDRRLAAVSGSTVNRGLNLISHVLNIARREWGIPVDNPVGAIRRPRNNRARRVRLNPAQEEALLAALETVERDALGRLQAGGRNPWMRPIVILALETAMRRSELLSMRWIDVDLERQFVRLQDTKNNETRDVPLSMRAVHELASLNRDPSGLVFPVSCEAVKKAFARAARRAGLDDLHFHDLRHEATSRLATKLSNVLELSATTGHKTLSMLQRYYHPDPSDLARKLG
jgi:integrase